MAESEALEAQTLPSSRLANEAVGTTTGYIQAPPHLLCPTGVELRRKVYDRIGY